MLERSILVQLYLHIILTSRGASGSINIGKEGQRCLYGVAINVSVEIQGPVNIGQEVVRVKIYL